MTSQTLAGLAQFSALCFAGAAVNLAELADRLQQTLQVRAGFWQLRDGTWQTLDSDLHADTPQRLATPPNQLDEQPCAWLSLGHSWAISLTPDPALGAEQVVWQALLRAELERLGTPGGEVSAEALIAALPLSVLVCDNASQRILWASPAAEEIWGPDAGQHPRVLDVQGAPLNGQAPFASLNGSQPTTSEISIHTHSGETQEFLASARRLDAARVVVALQDISVWRRRDAERDNAIAAIAHDLKNPLTTIRGSAELLLRRALSEERSQRELTRMQTIIEQADRMRDFLGTLVDVARLHSGELGLVRHLLDLGQLLKRTISARNASMAIPRIQFDLADVPPVDGDQIWLERVMENLLDNALKYSDPEDPVQVELAATEQWVEVSISDTGIGIPGAELERIFEQFTRGSNIHSRTHGSGLGLYTVRAVVQAHAGTIQARSDGTDQGSSFIVRLPVAGSIQA